MKAQKLRNYLNSLEKMGHVAVQANEALSKEALQLAADWQEDPTDEEKELLDRFGSQLHKFRFEQQLEIVAVFPFFREDARVRMAGATGALNKWINDAGDPKLSSPEQLVELLRAVDSAPQIRCYRKCEIDVDLKTRFLMVLGTILRAITTETHWLAGYVSSNDKVFELAETLGKKFFFDLEDFGDVLDSWMDKRNERYNLTWMNVAAYIHSHHLEELKPRLLAALPRPETPGAPAPFIKLRRRPMANCKIAQTILKFIREKSPQWKDADFGGPPLGDCPDFSMKPAVVSYLLHKLEPYVEIRARGYGRVRLTKAALDEMSEQGASSQLGRPEAMLPMATAPPAVATLGASSHLGCPAAPLPVATAPPAVASLGASSHVGLPGAPLPVTTASPAPGASSQLGRSAAPLPMAPTLPTGANLGASGHFGLPGAPPPAATAPAVATQGASSHFGLPGAPLTVATAPPAEANQGSSSNRGLPGAPLPAATAPAVATQGASSHFGLPGAPLPVATAPPVKAPPMTFPGQPIPVKAPPPTLPGVPLPVKAPPVTASAAAHAQSTGLLAKSAAVTPAASAAVTPAASAAVTPAASAAVAPPPAATDTPVSKEDNCEDEDPDPDDPLHAAIAASIAENIRKGKQDESPKPTPKDSPEPEVNQPVASKPLSMGKFAMQPVTFGSKFAAAGATPAAAKKGAAGGPAKGSGAAALGFAEANDKAGAGTKKFLGGVGGEQGLVRRSMKWDIPFLQRLVRRGHKDESWINECNEYCKQKGLKPTITEMAPFPPTDDALHGMVEALLPTLRNKEWAKDLLYKREGESDEIPPSPEPERLPPKEDSPEPEVNQPVASKPLSMGKFAMQPVTFGSKFAAAGATPAAAKKGAAGGPAKGSGAAALGFAEANDKARKFEADEESSGNEDLGPRPDVNYKTAVCPKFLSGTCRNLDGNCTLVHHEPRYLNGGFLQPGEARRRYDERLARRKRKEEEKRRRQMPSSSASSPAPHHGYWGPQHPAVHGHYHHMGMPTMMPPSPMGMMWPPIMPGHMPMMPGWPFAVERKNKKEKKEKKQKKRDRSSDREESRKPKKRKENKHQTEAKIDAFDI